MNKEITIQKYLKVCGNITEIIQLYLKEKTAENTPARGDTKDVEIIAPLKYLSTFWGTLEMPLVNYEINFILTWSSTCVITDFSGTGRFAITDAEIYVLFVTSLTQNYLKHCNLGLKEELTEININQIQKYMEKKYLNHLIDPGFQGVNRLFVLSFED